ncbi:MAG: hypothetical protein V4642_11930 [Bacteroidota bacterium]
MKALFFVFCLSFLLAVSDLQASSGTIHARTPATSEVRDIIQEIVDVIGLKTRFEIRTADNIDNAAAVLIGEKRFIFYDENFVKSINSAVNTDWAGVSILAHEIGHHLNGHTLNEKGSTHIEELEADEFSGFVLRRLGAGLGEAQAAMYKLSSEHGSATHPNRGDRLKAIEAGWQKADAQIRAEKSAQNRACSTAQTPSVAKAEMP